MEVAKMEVMDARKIAQKFVRVTSGRADDYEEGVRNPRTDWAKAALDAESNYEEGVRKGISRKAFGKGVTKCGTARQQEKTISKGVPHFIDGVSNAEDDMATAMEPVVAVLRSIQLPKRYPKRDPRNIERVKAIMKALGDAKEAGRF